MIGSKQLAFALCLFCGMHTFAHARPKDNVSRGELLYSTHCSACHASEVHWRKQSLAADWNSLVAQVRRWQASIGLGWGNEEIADVAHYLNEVYYGFPDADQKVFMERRKLPQTRGND